MAPPVVTINGSHGLLEVFFCLRRAWMSARARRLLR